MREAETKTLFSDFDDLYGLTKVFSRTHELFNLSYFYVADGSITPQPYQDENGQWQLRLQPGVWTGYLGGVEGLRQKGWMIFTVVLLWNSPKRKEYPNHSKLCLE